MLMREQSPAFGALRASSRRVLHLVESEIARQGGRAVIYADMLEICGSRRVYVPAMSELHALGLLDVQREPKRYVCRMSGHWREVSPKRVALISAVARAQPAPAVTAKQAAASNDAHA